MVVYVANSAKQRLYRYTKIFIYIYCVKLLHSHIPYCEMNLHRILSFIINNNFNEFWYIIYEYHYMQLMYINHSSQFLDHVLACCCESVVPLLVAPGVG